MTALEVYDTTASFIISARSGEQELDISANAVVEIEYDRRKQDPKRVKE